MKRPIVALIYDFDKTLSTTDMQEYSFIPSLNIPCDQFWKQSNDLAVSGNMDSVLAYMYLMMNSCSQQGTPLSRQMLLNGGRNIQYHHGVEQWFDNINSYGEQLGLEVRHYIISCGLRPMIEGCSIAKHFSNIFACDYMYNEDGVAQWPAMAINYTNKVQYIYRINKGVENIIDHKSLNRRMPEEEKPVKISNMIYFGDGETDVPSMITVTNDGGYAIGVYSNPCDNSFLVDERRVQFYLEADYSSNSNMTGVVKAILDEMATRNKITQLREKKHETLCVRK